MSECHIILTFFFDFNFGTKYDMSKMDVLITFV